MKVKVLKEFIFGDRVYRPGEVCEIEGDSLVKGLVEQGLVQRLVTQATITPLLGSRPGPQRNTATMGSAPKPPPQADPPDPPEDELERLERELREEFRTQQGSEVPPTWKPAPGEKLSGKILQIKRGVRTKIGQRDCLILQRKDGTKVTVWRSPTTERYFSEDMVGKWVTIELEQIWRPNPGEVLKGVIKDIRRGIPTKFQRPNDLMVIETPDGRQVGVWKKKTLEEYFNEENIGKHIAILYAGRTQGRTTQYDRFLVRLGT
ncbi:MAG: hypothetical protein QW356_04470 [Candidatus Hadarchaeales archaeon]